MRIPPAGLIFVAGLLSLVVGVAADRWTGPPSADVSRGTEDVFARGLQAREIPPRQGPHRWTTERSVFRFRNLPGGPAVLEVVLEGQREPVTVAAAGVILGQVPRAGGSLRASLPGEGRSVDVELLSPTFTAGDGRRLGASLRRVSVHPARAGRPSIAVLLLFLLPGVAVATAGGLSGMGVRVALLASLGVTVTQALALAPGGALRSGYASTLAGVLTVVPFLLAGAARLISRRFPGAAPWAFGCLLLAVLVQGMAASSPVMVVSDAMFHANKLALVARGDFFPLSVTQHAEPFRFPYGVSFYALLAPLWRAGIDGVLLVRLGAALGGIAASLALFLLLAGEPRRAGCAVIALQLLPATFEPYSFGNLSNVFGQAATVGAFAWWAGSAPGGFLVGATLLALAGLGHFSSLVVLIVLLPALIVARFRDGVGVDKTRLLATGVGGLAVAAYYLQFWDVAVAQLPRLLEGGGQGRALAGGAWGAAWFQAQGVIGQFGAPAIGLALLGLPRKAGQPGRDLVDRDLRAYWAAGALLALPAVLSPLEVRYLYALTLPLAVAAGTGFWHLYQAGGARRWAGCLLAALQATLAALGIFEAVVRRYRI